jgi:hypothetical protein
MHEKKATIKALAISQVLIVDPTDLKNLINL